VPAGSTAAAGVAGLLAGPLRRSTGYPLPVEPAAGTAPPGSVTFELADAGLGAEGYALTATRDGVVLRAATPAGLFRGTQTLRQLLPAAAERPVRQARRWTVPAVRIRDRPRDGWRGASLYVARDFLRV